MPTTNGCMRVQFEIIARDLVTTLQMLLYVLGTERASQLRFSLTLVITCYSTP